MKIPQSLRELLAKGPLAHLTTLNRDGSPQVTVVWVGIDGEEFVMGHLALHQKVKNIRRDPRVALSLLGDKTTQRMREYSAEFVTCGQDFVPCGNCRWKKPRLSTVMRG